jgi:hypothetical protein
MNIGINESIPDPDLPGDSFTDGPESNTGNDNNNKDNGGGDGGDGDEDIVDGPAVEAYVVLAKRKCEYYSTG